MDAHEFTGLPLARVAEVFQADAVERFTVDGQLAPKRRKPAADVPFVSYNMPDNAYMTGIWLAAQAMRWDVTKDPDAQRVVKETIHGLDLLQHVTGVDGLLARAAMRTDEPRQDDGTWRPSPDGRYVWRGDVSVDQMDGVFYGYLVAYDLAADEADRRLIAANVRALMDRLTQDDWRIYDVDRTPTRWGNYTPQYCHREPLNALLLLQHFAVAEHMTGDSRYAASRQALIDQNGYLDFVRRARQMADPTRRGGVNHSDDVLMLLAIDTVLRIEQDPTRREAYVASMRRMWEGADGWPGIGVENNPPATFIVRRYVDPNVYVEPALETLRLFPLDMKWDDQTLGEYERRFGFRNRREPVSPPAAPGRVVPIDRRPRSWSAWVADPYEAGDRTAPGGMEYNGHDFLWAYWMGRHYGFIGA